MIIKPQKAPITYNIDGRLKCTQPLWGSEKNQAQEGKYNIICLNEKEETLRSIQYLQVNNRPNTC